MADMDKVKPEAVLRYERAGFHIPEEYWPEIEAGVPWCEVMDSIPVYDTTPRRDPVGRLAEWFRRTFGRRTRLCGTARGAVERKEGDGWRHG